MTIEPDTKFGDWTVLQYLGADVYLCRCKCGTEKPLLGGNLKRGHTTKCRKCSQAAKPDAVRRHPLYPIWNGMITRCENPQAHDYANYGGRGICVCDRWHTFANFVADVSPRPPDMQLERADNDGPYSPSNVHWATGRENSNNRRNNRLVTIDGVTKTVSQWAETTGLPAPAIFARIYDGYTGQDIIKPLRHYRPRQHLC